MHEGVLALAEIERNGICIDLNYCEKAQIEITEKIKTEEDILHEHDEVKRWKNRFGAKFNMDSDHQLAKVLYEDMGIEVSKVTDSGNPSVDQSALEGIEHPMIKSLLRIRKLKKTRSTYLGNIVRESVNGLLHPFFNLHTVRTYRSSSQDPNFQNIPVRDPEIREIIRRVFIPRPGHRIGGSDYSGIEVKISACVTGDTLIETTEGSIPILDVINCVAQKKEVYVYGYDIEKSRVTISRVVEGGLTRKKAEVWKVTLDNKKVIKATTDHDFLLRSGEYTPLSELKPGDSLMPLYKKVVKSYYGTNYRHVYLNNGRWIGEHNLISSDVLGEEIKNSNKVVHHIDGNGCNNSLENLKIMNRKEHMSLHIKQSWMTPKKVRTFQWHKSEEGRKNSSDRNKRRNEEWTRLGIWEEFGKKISEAVRKRGGHHKEKNPMFGKKHSDTTREKISNTKKNQDIKPMLGKKHTEETRKKISIANSGRISSEETKLKISKTLREKGVWNRGKKGVQTHSEQTKEKISKTLKGRKRSEGTKRRLSESLKRAYKEGRINTEEKVKKMIRTRKTRGGYIAWNKGIPRSEETKVKIRGSLKKTRESKKLYNHKVESIEFYGFEDVYNITVEKIHNYAVGAGVIIKNCYHRDPTMLIYLNDPTTDMHRDMAMDCYLISDPKQVTKNTRYCSKNMFVFPEFYGDYFKNCAMSLWDAIIKMKLTLTDGTPLKDHLKSNGIKSYEKFEKHIQDVEDRFWNERFPVYKKWKENWIKAYERRGYFDTLTGFRCSGVMGKNDVINYPVQGVAFHCLLWSITQLQRWVKEQKLASKIIGQIHDEITKDLHADEFMDVLRKEKQIMCEDIREEWEWLKIVPLDIEASFADVDRPWNEVKPVVIV